MTLKQLIQRNSWESVSQILPTLYLVEEKDMEKYEAAFEKLTLPENRQEKRDHTRKTLEEQER